MFIDVAAQTLRGSGAIAYGGGPCGKPAPDHFERQALIAGCEWTGSNLTPLRLNANPFVGRPESASFRSTKENLLPPARGADMFHL